MKILALDLSTARGSLAWLDENAEATREWPNDRKNSGPLFDNLAATVNKLGPPKTIIVGLGPGSYAGTRIAISAAIGLQLSCRASLIGFPSICAMETEAKEYAVIGDARRRSFFFARISAKVLTEGPLLLSEEELHKQLASVDIPVFCSESLPQFQAARIAYPSARVLARLARELHHGFSLPPLEPIYLREPHITMPK
jgi:tRNA threonylcarbamoyl adenosine modification protein YeaZ